MKLTGAFVLLLLLAASATTAISQQEPKVIDLNVLAARGEALANEDPLALELRNLQPEGPARHGFDIGMAAAEGQTLPGPGKDRTCASLPAGGSGGCSIAVAFSVERNSNAKFAAIGAAIAKADERVAAARSAELENPRYREGSFTVFYRLGFDIATGIFGDPALGANGNTAWGPGSQKIRDSLSRAGQRGFNASVKFLLGQEPPPSAMPPATSPTRRPRTPDGGSAIDNSTVMTRADNFGKRSPALDEALTGFPKAGAEPPSNEIRCRGYGKRGGSEFVFSTINSRSNSAGETILTYEIGFTPSVRAAGANGEGLQPGECSFVDRTISERGPYRIRFETPANAQLKQQLHGTPLDTSPTAAERFPDAQTIPAYLRDPNHYWSFFGAEQVNNFFVATGYKYWKPEPVKAVARPKMSGTFAPPRPVCDVAKEARARNNPAAPGLEERCRTELAAKGAAIAQVDPVVAQARAAETDAQYQQGFDIATGIFGDPALGAQGNTATGPGSLGIRDSLSAAGQRGFNDAVKLHLSRNYKP
jgi:hypothetical protein